MKNFKYNFQVIKPVILEKGKNVIGHASSNVELIEDDEIEILKKRIQELEVEKENNKRKASNAKSQRNKH